MQNTVVKQTCTDRHETGTADKIKASLIHNAKVKKQYAAVLKKDGLEPAANQWMAMETVAGPSNLAEDNDSHVHGEGPSTTQDKPRNEQIPSATKEDIETRRVLHTRKSSKVERDAHDITEGGDGHSHVSTSSALPFVRTPEPFVHPSRRPGGKGILPDRSEAPKIDPGRPEKRARMSEKEVEQKRDDRSKEKKAWSKKNKKGQPDMVGPFCDHKLAQIFEADGLLHCREAEWESSCTRSRRPQLPEYPLISSDLTILPGFLILLQIYCPFISLCRLWTSLLPACRCTQLYFNPLDCSIYKHTI